MTKSTTLILLWMLTFTMLGFILGWLLGLLFSRTKYAEDKAEYLHNQLAIYRLSAGHHGPMGGNHLPGQRTFRPCG